MNSNPYPGDDDKYFATQNIEVQCGPYRMDPQDVKVFVEDALGIDISSDGIILSDDPSEDDYRVMFVIMDVADFIPEAQKEKFIKISINMGELLEAPEPPNNDGMEPWGF